MMPSSPMETSTTLLRSALTTTQRDEMFTLLSQYFEGVARAQFDRDLAEKNWAVLLRRDGRLVGFSTLLACEVSFEGAQLLAIYSGDTIVAPEAWGTPALARTWIAAVNRLRAMHPEHRCYWLLLTSGFRTYRFLPVFWREFFPCFAVNTPPAAARLVRHLAALRYGSLFDPKSGLVRFSQPQRLRGPLAGVPAGREDDPHVAFFLRMNPRHDCGDELVCLTEISEANLTAAGRRMIARAP